MDRQDTAFHGIHVPPEEHTVQSLIKSVNETVLMKAHNIYLLKDKSSGPGCSKLTTSLVNVSLKFQTLISQICQYFL